MNSAPYYFLSIIILLGGQIIWDHAWLLMVIIYGVLPLVDELFSQDLINPEESQRKRL